MTEPEREPSRRSLKWDTLGSGADLWATVVMASGFVLPAGQEVREHYRIVRPLGAGGMGQVLGVVLVGSPDPQMYALKMVARPQGDGRPLDAADRAAVEAQQKAFAALLRGEAAKQEVVQRHGVAVARLFALVRLEDGSLGLRMEVARGKSLESVLDEELRTRREQQPDFDFAIMVMRKVLYQLRKLHELVEPASPSGFVHSDMKPGNIFVDDGDRQDPFITLLDFGVSTAGHALDIDFAAGRKSLVLNDAGGTFGYAPPHHFTGKPTPLSDVYAALVILYEILALQSPWDFGGLAKTPANLFKLEDAMRNGPRPVRTGRPSISEESAAVLDTFFAAEFKSLHELAEEAHRARASGDETVRRGMTERLRTLAHDYQLRLDALRAQLTGRRTPDPSARISLERAETSVASVAAVEPPTAVESRARIRALRDDDEPADVPMRPLFGFKSALFVVLLAAGVFAAVWGVPAPIAQWAREQWDSWQGTPARTPATHGGPLVATPPPQADASVVALPAVVVDAGRRGTPPILARVIDAGSPPLAVLSALDAAVIVDAGTVHVAHVDVDAAALVVANVAPDVHVVADATDVAVAMNPTTTTIDAGAVDLDAGSPVVAVDAAAARAARVTPPPLQHPLVRPVALTPVHNTRAVVHPHPAVHAPYHPIRRPPPRTHRPVRHPRRWRRR